MKRSPAYYPFLFALFPPLFLFAHNIRETSFSEIFRPILIIFFFTSLLWLLLSLVMKNYQRAGLVLFIFLVSLFSYGHLMKEPAFLFIALAGFASHQGKILKLALVFQKAAFLIIFLIVISVSLKTRRNLGTITKFLNIATSFLIIFSLFNIAKYPFASLDYLAFKNSIDKVAEYKKEKLPDIYYIILDGYARNDILKSVYGYDNNEFLEYLRKKGFYVASKSIANYNQTNFSLGASLNFQYLDEFIDRLDSKSSDRRPILYINRNNRVVAFLKKQGYTYVVCTSGGGERMYGAASDIHIVPKMALSYFENSLVSTTFIPDFLSFFGYDQYVFHRRRIRYVFEQLPEITKIDSPVFAFVHIIAPHPPFVFDENGQAVLSGKEFSFDDGAHIMSRSQYIKQYKAQLAFITKKLQPVIDAILLNSPQEPIIILQADHGPGSMLYWTDMNKTDFKERMSILNVYYFPDNDYKNLYDSISPVNTFRVIFNQYFGTDYKLLEDKSYFASWHKPYKLFNVTDKVKID